MSQVRKFPNPHDTATVPSPHDTSEVPMSSGAANPLGTAPVGSLLLQYAVPSIIATLISSLYNMVDQMFIGQRIGFLGNAATTVAYPLTFLCGALTILFSNGSSVNFNICNGRRKTDEALGFAGAGLTLLALQGVIIGTLVFLFTPVFVHLFGATEEVFPYAVTYMRLIAPGLPFLAITSGGTLLIRSDGSPRFALFCSMAGVVTKVNFLFYSTIIGCSIGGQPIMGFNFGAGKYDRVKETSLLMFRYAFFIGSEETFCFWLFPHQILSLFGGGAGGYEAFALRYMHEFMLLVVLAGVLPVSMNTMVSIKQPKKGIIISLSKQLVLITLLLILPRFMGIDGVLCSGPIADFLVAVAAFVVIRRAFRALE